MSNSPPHSEGCGWPDTESLTVQCKGLSFNVMTVCSRNANHVTISIFETQRNSWFFPWSWSLASCIKEMEHGWKFHKYLGKTDWYDKTRHPLYYICCRMIGAKTDPDTQSITYDLILQCLTVTLSMNCGRLYLKLRNPCIFCSVLHTVRRLGFRPVDAEGRYPS